MNRLAFAEPPSISNNSNNPVAGSNPPLYWLRPRLHSPKVPANTTRYCAILAETICLVMLSSGMNKVATVLHDMFRIRILFLRAQWTTRQPWISRCLLFFQQTNVDPYLCRHVTSTGLTELYHEVCCGQLFVFAYPPGAPFNDTHG